MIPMAELPLDELAMWTNARGTKILFYAFEIAPDTKRMRILWTSSGTPIMYGVIGEDWMCEPLGVKVVDKAKEESENINVPLDVLTEIMRHKLCPRPSMDEKQWIAAVECMPQIVTLAERMYALADYDKKPFVKLKERRESKGLEMIGLMD